MRQLNSGRPILVCVIERHYLAAEHLLALLNQDPRFCAVRLEQMEQRTAPGSDAVFLVDNFELALPLSECLRRLTGRFPGARYLVLDRKQPEESVIRMLSLGIHGFLEHTQVPRRLVEAVLAISEGQMWVPAESLASYVQFSAASGRRSLSGSSVATSREVEIIELVRRRLSNKEIAAILKIQESTVKFHLSNIFAKLQVAGRHELVRRAEPAGDPSELLA